MYNLFKHRLLKPLPVVFFLLALVIGVAIRQVPLWVGGDRLATHLTQPLQRSSRQPSITHLPTTELMVGTNVVASTHQPPPKVSPGKLMTHVRALAFRRFTQDDRARARTYLTQTLQQLGWNVTPQAFEGGTNLLAEKTGQDPAAKKLLVGAHYDTVEVAPGADDNATGLAVLLELARLFQHRSTHQTLQLAFFDQEELGLLGSLAFTNNPANLQNLQGAIILDMVGYACYTDGCQHYPEGMPIPPPSKRGDFLAVIGDQAHPALLNAFRSGSAPKLQGFNLLPFNFYTKQADLPAIVALSVPLQGLLTPDLLRSDHAPFWYRQVGAILLTDTANFRSPHYHQASDTPTTLDPDFFTRSAQLVVNAVTSLLNPTSASKPDLSQPPPA